MSCRFSHMDYSIMLLSNSKIVRMIRNTVMETKIKPALRDTSKKEFWISIILGFLVTPLFLFLAASSTGAGYGDYFFAQLLFPYTMLSALLFDSITGPFIVIAFIQYILYGCIIGVAFRSGRENGAVLVIGGIHSAAVILCFFTLGDFVRHL